MKESELIKGAALTGLINAVINGGIQYFFLKDVAPISISVDSITNNEQTVLGAAVSLGITLAMISTVVAYMGIKEAKIPFFPKVFWSVIKHGFFTFGIITSLAVFWQSRMGSVEVSLTTALIIIGVIAGLVAGVVNYLTLKACTIDSNENKNVTN